MAVTKQTASRNRNGKGRRKQAQKIPPQEWKLHKAEIRELYLTDDRTQQEVVDHLRIVRGFGANKRQLISQLKKWGFAKYRQKTEAVTSVKGKEPLVENQTTTNMLPHAQDALPLAVRGEAAEVHFALANDTTAWLLCRDLYAATTQQTRFPAALSATVVILSRSALSKDQVSDTEKILDVIWEAASSKNDDHTAFKCRLLKAHMQVQHGDNAIAALGKSDLQPKHLIHYLQDTDFLTAHLARVLGAHANVATPPSSFSDGNDGYSALQSCILWSARQLKALHNMPIQLDRLNGMKEKEILNWREETELFLALWHRWQTSNGNVLSWVLRAETKLGITASELLATVSCMILDISDETQDHDDDDYDEEDQVEEDKEDDFEDTEEAESVTTNSDEDESDQELLLEAANDRVQILESKAREEGGRQEIWRFFSGMFYRRNIFLSDEEGRPSWMTDALEIIGEFVTRTLTERPVI